MYLHLPEYFPHLTIVYEVSIWMRPAPGGAMNCPHCALPPPVWFICIVFVSLPLLPLHLSPSPPISATTKRPPLLLPVEKYQTPAHLCRAQGSRETRQTGTQRSPQRAEVFGCPGKSSACQVVPGLTLFLVDEIINQDYSRWNYKSGSIQVT